MTATEDLGSALAHRLGFDVLYEDTHPFFTCCNDAAAIVIEKGRNGHPALDGLDSVNQRRSGFQDPFMIGVAYGITVMLSLTLPKGCEILSEILNASAEVPA